MEKKPVIAPKGCEWLIIHHDKTVMRVAYISNFKRGLTAFEAWAGSHIAAHFSEVEVKQITEFPDKRRYESVQT